MVELALIVVLGIFAQWIAWKSRIPAILPLILIGLAVGPIAEYFNGAKLISPLKNGTQNGLFTDDTMFAFISLAIGVILFEGGLTLKFREIKGVGKAIVRLITIGSLITFIGGGIAAFYIMNLSMELSFLFAALIIVTGPTVIAPILRNVPLTKNVAAVLKWEGILIDPIGALVAVLVFEFILASEGNILTVTGDSLITFFKIILVGASFGFGAAHGLYQMIKREYIPEYLLNVFTLALVLLMFVLSDLMAHESGLLTVVVMGMTLANLKVPRLKTILDFKESLTVLLISILFIILSANINWEQLEMLNMNTVLLFLVIVFILRPLSVFASTGNSDLIFNEKLFISWVGPRGIVAAGIASLFSLKLMQKGIQEAEILTPLVFAIVLGTVVLNATTARLMASLLKVKQAVSDGILIVGANTASRIVAKYLHSQQKHVVVIDNSEEMIEKARDMGLDVIQANVYNMDLEENFDLLDMGYMMTMTSNDSVNEYVCKHYQEVFGENGTYRLISKDEMEQKMVKNENQTLFANFADFYHVNEIAKDNATPHQIQIKSTTHFEQMMKELNKRKFIPLFIKHQDGRVTIISAQHMTLTYEDNDSLVYLGEPIQLKENKPSRLEEQFLSAIVE